MNEKLEEIFNLLKLVGSRGVPMKVSPFRSRIIELVTDVLLSYGLPREQGFENIFFEMVRQPDWDEAVCSEAISNLKRSQLEHESGQAEFKSAVVKPKKQLKNGTVYLSLELAFNYVEFLNSISDVLHENMIRLQFISPTNDIWCRDYMPIPVSKDKFVQFVYDPDYLKGKDHLKTDPWAVTKSFDFSPIRSELIIDGGNVIKNGKTVIMTEKIFTENRNWSKPDLIKQISKELEIDKVVIIPIEPEDFTGHSDGMVRFVGEDSVIINDYLSEDGYTGKFITDLRLALQSNGIKIIGTLPYRSFPRKNKDGDITAIGCYMNFLELDDLIIIPKFEITEDDLAYSKIQEYFPLKKVVQLDCRVIAEEGGVLNCISWTF